MLLKCPIVERGGGSFGSDLVSSSPEDSTFGRLFLETDYFRYVRIPAGGCGWLARSSPAWLVKMTDVHRNLSRSTRRGIHEVGPDSGYNLFRVICICLLYFAFLCVSLSRDGFR